MSVCGGFGLAFTVSSGLAYGAAALPPSLHGSAVIALHGLLTLCMLGAWGAARESSVADARWLLGCGIAARLLLVAVPPFTTHDVDRYLWDGRVALAGYDPYRLAPDAEALAWLRPAWPTPAEHAAYPTLYPPGALALFAAAASAGSLRAPWLWKLMAAGGSIATLLVAARWLREAGQERQLALVACSPLLVLEAGVGGHVDVFAALAVVFALALASAARPFAAGAAIGVGALVKLFPIVVALPLAAGFARRDRTRLLAGAALGVGLGYSAALAAGLEPLGCLPMFLERWRFGSPLFAAIERAQPGKAAPLILGTLALSTLPAATILALRGHPVAGAGLALGAVFAASPVVFPWYLSPLVPIAAMGSSWTLLAWVSAAPLGYEVLDRFSAGLGWAPRDWPPWCTAATWPLEACSISWAGGGEDESSFGSRGWSENSRCAERGTRHFRKLRG